MFEMAAPWWEFVVRGIVVYVAVLFLLRINGKRTVGQLSPFDFVLLLILSNAVQNAMNAGDNSLIGGLIVAVTLIVFDYLLDRLSGHVKWLDRLVLGTPQVLVRNGRINWSTMKSAGVSRGDLNAALRRNGVIDLTCIRVAMLERSGNISVVQKGSKGGGGG